MLSSQAKKLSNVGYRYKLLQVRTIQINELWTQTENTLLRRKPFATGWPNKLTLYTLGCFCYAKSPKQFIRWLSGFKQNLLQNWKYSSNTHYFQVLSSKRASPRCLKITEKVSFNIASEASYVYILNGQKLIKNAQNGQFWKVFEKLKLAVKQCYQTGQF